MKNRITLLMAIFLISLFSLTTVVKANDDCSCPKNSSVLLAHNTSHMKRVKIKGTVETIQPRQTIIKMSDGRTVTVLTGPESYWEYKGYKLAPGEKITVYGYYPQDKTDWFYASSVAGKTYTYKLTDSNGMPYWVETKEYRSYPTYEVYETWYGPTYIYTLPPSK